MKLNTVKAIRLILNNTDSHSEEMFLHFKEEFQDNLPKHKSADEYLNALRRRTDISEDDKEEIECLEFVIKAIFLLEGAK